MIVSKDQLANKMQELFKGIDYNYALELITKDCQNVREQAHKEYAQRSDKEPDNVFANFERLSEKFEGSVTREQVLWVYLTKHIDGIQSHINGNKSQRESVQGRIKDAIVYLIILRAMEDQNDEEKPFETLYMNSPMNK